jgi:hypothetical protein
MDLYYRYGITAQLPIMLGDHESSDACPLVDRIKVRKDARPKTQDAPKQKTKQREKRHERK